MAYHALEESKRLIAAGVPEVTFRLTRRRRFLPVGVDVDGDLAGTLFIRRGVSGDPWLEGWSLKRIEGDWTMLGGGAGSGYTELFSPRPNQTTLRALAIPLGGGSTLVNADRLLPFGARYVHTATMRLASEVASLLVGERRIAVPDHGLAIVVWSTRRTPKIEAMSPAGASLGTIDLPRAWRPQAGQRSRALPRWVRSGFRRG